MDNLQQFLTDIGSFINGVLVPFLFSAALLFFVVNAVRFFIIGKKDETKQQQARQLAFYGISAFVLLVSLWGIVNLFVSGLELDRDEYICPDYLQQQQGGCGGYGGGYRAEEDAGGGWGQGAGGGR